jgi:hypothetical protein
MAGVRRETLKQFWSRVEQEGRRAQAEATRTELLAKGVSKRAAQAQLVAKFQPLDGTRSCAWPTPNSWEKRRYWKKPSPDSRQQLEVDLQWVYNNRDRSPEEAPTSGARWWMEVALKSPAEFMRAYREALKNIVSRQEQQLSRKRKTLPQDYVEDEDDYDEDDYDDDYDEDEDSKGAASAVGRHHALLSPPIRPYRVQGAGRHGAGRDLGLLPAAAIETLQSDQAARVPPAGPSGVRLGVGGKGPARVGEQGIDRRGRLRRLLTLPVAPALTCRLLLSGGEGGFRHGSAPSRDGNFAENRPEESRVLARRPLKVTTGPPRPVQCSRPGQCQHVQRATGESPTWRRPRPPSDLVTPPIPCPLSHLLRALRFARFARF